MLRVYFGEVSTGAQFRHRPLILLCLLYALTAVVLGGAGSLVAPPLIWLTVTDLERQVIPDAATGLVAVYGVARMFLVDGELDFVTLMLAALTFGVLAVAGEVYWRRHHTEVLGLGDAKLIGAGVLVVGAGATWLMLLLASSGGIVAALLTRRSANERGIPFGPFLAYAIFVFAALTGQEAPG